LNSAPAPTAGVVAGIAGRPDAIPMQGHPRQERSLAALIRQAITIFVVTLVSVAALMVISNKIRATWGVMEMLERRVDGMIASGSSLQSVDVDAV
jgi:hypothetical protein